MKTMLTLLMFMGMAVSQNSCVLLDLFKMLALAGGFGNSNSHAYVIAIDDAMHGNEPAVLGPGGGEEIKTPLPPDQIVGEPIASEPGGGNQQEEESASTFMDIFKSPTFILGPSLSWLGGDKGDSEKFPPKPGFQLGANWQVPLTDRVNFEPGLLYANRGLGYESEESGNYGPGVPGGYSYSYGQKKRLQYLELPLFASYSIMEGLDLYGGPQVAFLLGAKVVNESDGETTSTEKGTTGFNKVDFGLSAGARYLIPNTFFSVSLGYYHGFSNLSSGSDSYSGYGSSEAKYFTNSARLGVCYTYRGSSNRTRSAGTGRKVQ